MILGRRAAPSLTAEQQAEQQRSLAEIQAGRLPLVSRARLERTASDPVPFASDLSSADFAAVVAAGYAPAGQVFGAAAVAQGARYYRHPPVGFGTPVLDRPASMSGWFDGERRAWSLALGRLIDEVTLLEADGAIGLRMLRRTIGIAEVAEFSLVATAVRRRDREPGGPRPESPFVTALDGRALAGLQRRGLRPYGPVFVRDRRVVCGRSPALGRPVLGAPALGARPRASYVASGNYELSGPTALMNDARSLAGREMASAARRLRGGGAVLHSLDVETEFGECVAAGTTDYVADVRATATVIGPIDDRARGIHARRSDASPIASADVRAVVPL